MIIISGPTASGKSEISLKIAQNHNGVVVNCDSKQIYKEIPLITAQPIDKNGIDHRLYGYVSVKDNYSVNLWLEDLNDELNKLPSNKIAIITGGSGLYISTFINGLSDIPVIPIEVRSYAKHLFEELSKEKFYELLIAKHPLSHNLHMNDSYRVLRAFEVITATGKSIFSWRNESNKRNIIKDLKLFILWPSRELIYKKINQRFQKMIMSGLVEEIQKLANFNLSPHSPALKAHGVPEIMQYLNNDITLQQAIETAQMNIRRYAKRQYTWFKNQFPFAKFVENDLELNDEIKSLFS